MDTITIKQSIQNWISIRENASSINKRFEQGNCFSFEVPDYMSTSDDVHVYPGVNEGVLLFFVIPAQYDDAAYEDDISTYTTVCTVGFSVGGGNDHEITSAEAHARILAWEDYHETWVVNQIATIDGMFEAFSVAGQDFECKEVVMTLGLKNGEGKKLLADLIVTNDKSDVIVYDDFVKPVPPFDAAATSLNKFYLLTPVS